MRPTNATIEDVAAYAGVSTATVSRCLNHPEKVRDSVKNKVDQAILALKYVPHGAARALASRRSRTIGAIVPTLGNAIFSEFIQNLQTILTNANYTLLIACSSYCLEQERKEVRSLISRGIDGLVLIGQHHDPDVYAAVDLHKIAYVSLWTYSVDSERSCIGFDNIKAGRELATHLMEYGHRDIAVVTGYLENNDRVTQRLDGVRQIVAQYDGTLSDDGVVECRYSVEQGRQAVHKIIEANPQVTAVICSNDVLALGVLWGAREQGIPVPGQLSVTGFDNMEMIPAIVPALTTMDSPSSEMGIGAGKYLIDQIEKGRQGVSRVEMVARLIPRDTTGPVAQKKNK